MDDVDIDPEYREYLAEQARENGGIVPRHAHSTAGARAQITSGPERDPLPVRRTRDLSVSGPDGGVPVRCYWPETGVPHPVLVWIHGGGWVRGTLDSAGGTARALARRAECLVVAVDYRQAPEHPFPAAFEDAYAVTRWVHEHAGRLGGDPDRVALGGHSAGGNLSAAVALAARDRGEELGLRYQALLNPVLDFDFTRESYRRFDLAFWTNVCPDGAGGSPLSREDMAWYRERYLAHDVDAHNPYAAPLRARSVADLPPALVVTSELDPLRDEGLAYAERLREAGVAVTAQNHRGVFHSYLPSFRDLAGADEELDAVATRLQSALE
jgi:acetyl esterase